MHQGGGETLISFFWGRKGGTRGEASCWVGVGGEDGESYSGKAGELLISPSRTQEISSEAVHHAYGSDG